MNLNIIFLSVARFNVYWYLSTYVDMSMDLIYDHIEVVVAFLVVIMFVCLVIARYHAMRFSQKLTEMFLLASRNFRNPKKRDHTAGKPQK